MVRLQLRLLSLDKLSLTQTNLRGLFTIGILTGTAISIHCFCVDQMTRKDFCVAAREIATESAIVTRCSRSERLQAQAPTVCKLLPLRTHRGHSSADNSDHSENYPDALPNSWLRRNPVNELNKVILNQWETWFTEMDKNVIDSYFYFYDDDKRSDIFG